MYREDRRAFLALPRGALGELKSTLTSVLQENGFQPWLPSEETSATESVQAALRDADVVIADLSGPSSFVLFEVGLALGLRKPTLLLSQGPLQDLPADLAAYQVASYRPTELGTLRRYISLWLQDFASSQSSSASY